MYREEGERGYKCIFGGGRGYLRGPEVGGAIIGWALGSFWWVGRGGFVSLNGLAWDHLSVHHSLGGWVILGYLWASHGFHKTQP